MDVNIKLYLSTIVKIISIIFITGAIGLELWNIFAVINNIQVPSSLNVMLGIGRLAITVHFIEAVIAAFYALSKNKMAMKFGVYTFFVGTVGLLELFQEESH